MIESYTYLISELNKYAQLILERNVMREKLTLFGNYDFVTIIPSGINKFENDKIYIDTASVSEDNINSRDYVINYENRPSRANMQPVVNSTWIAKLKDSPKFILINDYSQEILNEFVLSTGFLGVLSPNRFVNNYIFALVSSNSFQERKNQISIGATMQGINNDSFKNIQVPNLNITQVTQIGKSLDSVYEQMSDIKKKTLILKNVKKNLLEKFFQ